VNWSDEAAGGPPATDATRRPWNAFLSAHGSSFPAAAALPALLGIAYFLMWRFIVGPLTAALDVRVDT